MTKELSKQLCVLCGIEPKYYFYDLRHKEFIEIIHKKYLKLKNEYQTKEAYPDFGKPENFVRLFKLITTIEDYNFKTGFYRVPHIPSYNQYSYLNDGYYVSNYSDPIKAFIDCVKECVEEDKDTANYIREAEWVYV